MIALVKSRNGWSIARIYLDDWVGFEWWCGDRDEWVSPLSQWWEIHQGLRNVTFATRSKAEAFAKAKGWL